MVGCVGPRTSSVPTWSRLCRWALSELEVGLPHVLCAFGSSADALGPGQTNRPQPALWLKIRAFVRRRLCRLEGIEEKRPGGFLLLLQSSLKRGRVELLVQRPRFKSSLQPFAPFLSHYFPYQYPLSCLSNKDHMPKTVLDGAFGVHNRKLPLSNSKYFFGLTSFLWNKMLLVQFSHL